MTRKKEYPGRLVRNTRYHNKKMHLVSTYWSSDGMEVGIYSDAYDIFIDELARRIRSNQQNIIIIEGDTGAGKSTLAIPMCYDLAKKLRVDFDLKRDYIYSVQDLVRKMDDPTASTINLMDEAALILNSRRSQSTENVDIINLFNTMRSLGWTTFLIAPSKNMIDLSVRQAHTDFLIHCSSNDDQLKPGFGRGFFEVMVPKRGRFRKSKEPYWYLTMTGIFGKLPPKIDKIYQPIKAEAQLRLRNRTAKKHRIEEEEGVV